MTDTAAQSTAPAATRRPKFGQLERAGLPIFLVIIIAVFAVIPATGPAFRTLVNINNVLANQSVTGLIALSMVIPMIAGYFDLSAAAVAGLSNVTVASLVAQHGQSVAVSLIAGVVIGVLAGGLNAFLVSGLNLDPFITTLGTYIFWAGTLALYTRGKTISNGIPIDFSLWTTEKWLGVPTPFWILIIVAVVVWFFVTQLPFGRRLAAIGSNEMAAKLAGVRTRRAVAITYLLSGLLAGIAGALLTSSNGGGDSSSAISYLFPALAAVFLGRTAIDPGHYNVWGTMFGLFLVAVAVDGFTLMGAPASVTQMFNGGALVFSVAVATFTTRARERKARAIQLENLHNS
ncbi:ABC transporter permease [Amycolatopsis sp. K13G38]|uniref:ABC transporter permease n=1 Tax=Amycolatopsis acididurans TaxID=2724524 RepID=A0ABX1J6T8_9PSEU|nr:ABC transporter permease [Amycolatopsis acididurans]NKQ55506.1 ABC transporter permease [Amycolatopsis acididurans]